LKRLIGLISVGLLVGLLVFSPSLVAAQRVTVSREQTLNVHVNVYKPAGISFPPDGARLRAFLYKPTMPWTIYSRSGTMTLNWGNEERQENFSLAITVAGDEPAGETLYLRVRLYLDTNPIYAGSGITVTMTAVEVNGEKTDLSVRSVCSSASVLSTGEQGIPYWHERFNLYAVDTAISDVLIAAAPGALPAWAIVAIVVVLVLIIAIALIVKKKGTVLAPPSPEPLAVPRD